MPVIIKETAAHACAREVAEYLAKNELNEDVSIYADGKRYKISDAGELVYDIDANPKDYLEYAGDFLSMSFEGILYEVLNYGDCERSHAEESLDAIFEKYGKFKEYGNAWNLSLYDL